MVGTLLVTGATGTVGGEVVKQLSSTGQKVRASVRSTTRVTSNDKLKDVELMEMDYQKLSKDDWATTYILDGSFGYFVSKNRNILPDWFLEAITI
ncbi:MAG: NAD(P)H-binding protein [Candidatus Nitrosopolaris sp.]